MENFNDIMVSVPQFLGKNITDELSNLPRTENSRKDRVDPAQPSEPIHADNIVISAEEQVPRDSGTSSFVPGVLSGTARTSSKTLEKRMFSKKVG